MEAYDDSTELEQVYGKLLTCTFYNYDKFEFVLKFTCEKYPGKTFLMHTGGLSGNIYRYVPEECDWGEHVSAGITQIYEQ